MSINPGIRQAILAYKRAKEEEELMLVHRGVEVEMKELEEGKARTHSFEE